MTRGDEENMSAKPQPLKWKYRETNDSEYASAKFECFTINVQDCDGDMSCWAIKRGTQYVAMGELGGLKPYHFHAAMNLAEQTLAHLWCAVEMNDFVAKPAPGADEIEAVAKALWQSESVRAPGRARLEPWSEVADRNKQTFRQSAHDAVKAMRPAFPAPAAAASPRRYSTIVHWSDEDEAFIAEVPELPGCCSDGPTPQDSLASVQGAIDEWIEACTKAGNPVPAPRLRSPAAEVDLLALLDRAEKALKPFSDRVFNDNGDCTVSDTYLCKHDDYIRANFVHKALVAAVTDLQRGRM